MRIWLLLAFCAAMTAGTAVYVPGLARNLAARSPAGELAGPMLQWTMMAAVTLATALLLLGVVLLFTLRALRRQRRRQLRCAQELRLAVATQRALVGATGAGVVALNADGTIRSVDRTVEKTFGWHAADLVGHPLTSLMPERDRAAWLARWADEASERTRRAFTGLHRDGDEFAATLAVRVVEGALPPCYLAVFSALAERRAASPDAGPWQALVASVSDYAIFMLAPDGRVLTWNDGAERIKGYRADEIIGRHFSCFYPPEARAAGMPQRVLQAALDSGRHEERGWRLRRDGERFFAHVVITPLRDQSGQLHGYTKVTRELCEAEIPLTVRQVPADSLL